MIFKTPSSHCNLTNSSFNNSRQPISLLHLDLFDSATSSSAYYILRQPSNFLPDLNSPAPLTPTPIHQSNPIDQKLASSISHPIHLASQTKNLHRPSPIHQANLIRYQTFPRQQVPSAPRTPLLSRLQRRINTSPSRLRLPRPLTPRKSSTMPSYSYRDSYSSGSSRSSSSYPEKPRAPAYEPARGSTSGGQSSSSSSSSSKSRDVTVHNYSSRLKDTVVRRKESDSRYHQ